MSHHEQLDALVERIIEVHDLNPAIEKRAPLAAALGISRVTQWRQEKRLSIQPDGFVGDLPCFDTHKYLTTFLSRGGRERGAA